MENEKQFVSPTNCRLRVNNASLAINEFSADALNESLGAISLDEEFSAGNANCNYRDTATVNLSFEAVKRRRSSNGLVGESGDLSAMHSVGDKETAARTISDRTIVLDDSMGSDAFLLHNDWNDDYGQSDERPEPIRETFGREFDHSSPTTTRTTTTSNGVVEEPVNSIDDQFVRTPTGRPAERLSIHVTPAIAMNYDYIPNDGHVDEDGYQPYFGDDDCGFLDFPPPITSTPRRVRDANSPANNVELVTIQEEEDYVPHFNEEDDDVVELDLSTSSSHSQPMSSSNEERLNFGMDEHERRSSSHWRLLDMENPYRLEEQPCTSTTAEPITTAEPAKVDTDKRPAIPTVNDLLQMKGRVNLADLITPVRPTRKTAKSISVQDEFFGVYCLISRSEHKAYKNRCYIGYTVNPNRRIRQHNAGHQFGGAKKTDSRGPWDMVCIIHGFPNSISALRFEWAWQNPAKSKRLRDFESLQRKARNQTPFEYRLKIACRMLNSDPWRRLALTFRWLLPEFAIPFPAELPPPPHVQMARGIVTKTETVVPTQINEYACLRSCQLCDKPITQLKRLLRCLNAESCGAHFHVRCWAENELVAQDELHTQLVPLSARCPICVRLFLWGDLIRDQRIVCAVDAAKPCDDGLRIADGMVPRQLQKM